MPAKKKTNMNKYDELIPIAVPIAETMERSPHSQQASQNGATNMSFVASSSGVKISALGSRRSTFEVMTLHDPSPNRVKGPGDPSKMKINNEEPTLVMAFTARGLRISEGPSPNGTTVATLERFKENNTSGWKLIAPSGRMIGKITITFSNSFVSWGGGEFRKYIMSDTDGEPLFGVKIENNRSLWDKYIASPIKQLNRNSTVIGTVNNGLDESLCWSLFCAQYFTCGSKPIYASYPGQLPTDHKLLLIACIWVIL